MTFDPITAWYINLMYHFVIGLVLLAVVICILGAIFKWEI